MRSLLKNDHLYQTCDFGTQQEFVVLRYYPRVHSVQADRVQPLERFAHAFRPSEEWCEDFAPVVSLADNVFIVREVGICDQGLFSGASFQGISLLLLPLIIKAIWQAMPRPIGAELSRHQFVDEAANVAF